MLRGLYKYVCKDCGHKFIGADIELNATAVSVPVKCPKCGSVNTSSTGLPYPLCEIPDMCRNFFRRMGKSQEGK